VSFDPETGRFEVRAGQGQAVAKDRVVALLMERADKRGMTYEIRWGEPPPRAASGFSERALPFELPTLAGERYELVAPAWERPLVVVFWASWCGPCVAEAPHLVKLHKEYGERVELVSVSIDAAEDHQTLRRVAAELGIDYPIALDPEGELLARYASGAGIPLTFVFARDGALVYHHDNYQTGDEEALVEAVERALVGAAP